MKCAEFIPVILIFMLIFTGFACSGDSIPGMLVRDTPNDGGGSITVEIGDDVRFGDNAVRSLYRKSAHDATWLKIGDIRMGKAKIIDSNLANGIEYFYGVEPEQGTPDSLTLVGSAIPLPQLFNFEQLPLFVGTLLVVVVFLYATFLAPRRGTLSIRKVAGLAAVDEAIGRATEMGRAVLFTPGWGGDIQRPTTIAALNILNLVAEKTSTYNCDLIFPTHDPVIMSAAQETIRQAYLSTGHLDLYNPDNVYFTTSSQFGYAAAVDGAITRLKPATVMLLGTFEGEALILAETANSIGAMQIAGTDSTIQLAFFLVACDYTLIGEELFAASGYLSGDVRIISSIKAQDFLKVILITLLVAGGLLATFGFNQLKAWIR